MEYIIVAITVCLVLGLDHLNLPWLEKVFNWIPAILFSYIIPAITCYAFGLDFSAGTIHDYSKQYIMPLAILAVMSSLSLVQLKALGIKPIILFFMGAISISLFPVIIMYVFQHFGFVEELLIDQGYWQGLIPVIGDWIGGSTSQIILKEIVACPEHIFLSVFLVDNVLVNLWTIAMFQLIKRSDDINSILGIKNAGIPVHTIRNDATTKIPNYLVLLILGSIVIVFQFLSMTFVWKIILLSVLGLMLSNLIPGWRFVSVLKIAHICIITIMAILGLKLRFEEFIWHNSLVVLLVTWLLFHISIMTIGAKILHLHFSWVPIASMANVGGIATAPAVTSAYKKEWMAYAVVLAILSMATGTFFGMISIWLISQYCI